MATYWYNASPKSSVESESVQENQKFRYDWRCIRFKSNEEDKDVKCKSVFKVGTQVYVKPPISNCTTTWKTGKVTKAQQGLSVWVDNIPRHVADVRLVPNVRSITHSPDETSARRSFQRKF